MRLIDLTQQSMGWDNPWQTRKTSDIVNIGIHHSATANGSQSIFENYWKTLGWRNGGYSEIILLNGDVEICYVPTVVTNGVSSHNTNTYHICVVGDFRVNGAQATAAQERSLIERIRVNMNRFNVPVERVLGHNEFSGHASNICPGRNMNTLRSNLRLSSSSNPTITGNGVNFRRGPGTNYGVIRVLPRGTTVTFLGTNEDGSWTNISEGNDVGWVSSEFIDAPNIQVSAHTRLAITTMNSPFRYGPGTSYDTIRTIPIYNNVEITGSHGTWRRVMVNNQFGWIHENRLTYRTRFGRITQNTVLRSSAHQNGAVIRDLPSGFNLDIIGVSHDRNWRRVRVGNQTGWVSTPHITTRNDSARTTLGGWLRPGPLASSGEVHYVNQNTSITILGESGSWTQARVDNHSGWIATGRVTAN